LFSPICTLQAFNAIKHYRDLASIEYNASHFTGIATAVFRESTNGGVFISQVSQELGISLKVCFGDWAASQNARPVTRLYRWMPVMKPKLP
jgi:exopolyphosphatase/pppGpp-phosphohydrolase